MDFSAAEGFYGTNADTPNANKDKATQRRLQNVVPVCIRQIRDSPGEDLVLFGMKAQIISLMGILKDYDVSSTKVSYTLEDHTGTISAILWLENESNTSSLPSVKEGHYCHVFGNIRTADEVKSVLVLKIIPVENPNDITSHLLQVIHARLMAEKLSKEMGSSSRIALNNPSMELANSMMETYGSNMGSGLNAIQKKIYSILEADNSPNGLSRDKILNCFPPNQHRNISNEIDFLSSEGHLYSTIDPEHFKATG